MLYCLLFSYIKTNRTVEGSIVNVKGKVPDDGYVCVTFPSYAPTLSVTTTRCVYGRLPRHMGVQDSHNRRLPSVKRGRLLLGPESPRRNGSLRILKYKRVFFVVVDYRLTQPSCLPTGNRIPHC